MDNLTHTLFGFALAKTGLERTTPGATAALLIGANFPDIDLVTLLWGSLSYLKHHRGITHSLAGIVVAALIIGGVLHFAYRRRLSATPQPRFWALCVVALAGVGSHFLLDYTNSYGVRPFLPFSRRWYAGDLVFVIDPWMLALLFVGLGFPFLLRLVQQEIGAKPTSYGVGACFSLGLVVAFWGCKFVSHQRAIEELRQQTYSSGSVLRAGAFPQFLNPFGWYGVVETETAYHLVLAGWAPLRGSFERQRVRVLRKHSEMRIVQSTTKAEQARVFLDFARYPLIQVNPAPQGYEVVARDLRFDFASQFRTAFLCTVLLDKNLNVMSAHFRY
jgi:inner membrane protein